MKRIHFNLSIGYPTAKHEDIVEYEDTATDDEIQSDFSEWVDNYLDMEWWEEEQNQ